ncbi:MAG: prepilin-type N-terminal cleavage/methylation domain-containing protein [Deltaproteobacteria bacterium]|nr:prepilin-type N-terminal cleavage/methylation domain-containing protein [Deltaproteobacteria bacterium]
MKSRKNNSKSGFTLIEVIITLVVVAVIAAMMTAYFGKGITQSSIPIFRLTAAGKLNDIMEKITAEYDKIPRWSPNTYYAVGTIVIPTPLRRNGYQYICTVAGTSGTVEPGTETPTPTPWPVVSGGMVTETTGSATKVRWLYNGLAPKLSGPLPGLQTRLAETEDLSTPKAGVVGENTDHLSQPFGGTATIIYLNYRLVHNRFITFNTSNTPATEVGPINSTHVDYGRYLKVTIALHPDEPNRTDETLTTLFVLR